MQPVSSKESTGGPFAIHVLKGGGEYGPAVSLCWNERLGEFAELYYYLVLLRNSNCTILINTGMPEDYSAFQDFVKTWHPSCNLFREDCEKPRQALGKVGVTPEQIDIVVLTPHTAYTTGNLRLFSRAKFAVNRRGWLDFWAPEKHASRLPPDIAMPRESREFLAGDAFDRMHLLEDEDEICPGVGCFWTGGHHMSSMAIQVKTAKGTVIIGDCFFTYENLTRNVPIGWAENHREIYAAYDRIRRTADITIPLYDPEVLRRFPDGKVA